MGGGAQPRRAESKWRMTGGRGSDAGRRRSHHAGIFGQQRSGRRIARKRSAGCTRGRTLVLQAPVAYVRRAHGAGTWGGGLFETLTLRMVSDG
jgi:hypothetical protein